MKLTVEVGPLQNDERLLVLNTLEKYGVRIKESSKEEGKKYTRICTPVIQLEEADFTDKPKLINAMNELYQSGDFNRVLDAIRKTVNELVNGEVNEEELGGTNGNEEAVDHNTICSSFMEFIQNTSLEETEYRANEKKPHFVLPEFRNLESKYGRPRWNYWLNNCVIMFFERLKDNRLKFNIEVGPLESEKRLQFVSRLEAEGLRIQASARNPDASYSKIFTGTSMIQNWGDEEEILEGMRRIYLSDGSMKVIEALRKISFE